MTDSGTMWSRLGAKYRWLLAPADEAATQAIAHGCGIDKALARALYVRGYTTVQEAQNYLVMGSEWIADPTLLHGASAAADRIVAAIEKNEKIL